MSMEVSSSFLSRSSLLSEIFKYRSEYPGHDIEDKIEANFVSVQSTVEYLGHNRQGDDSCDQQ